MILKGLGQRFEPLKELTSTKAAARFLVKVSFRKIVSGYSAHSLDKTVKLERWLLEIDF